MADVWANSMACHLKAICHIAGAATEQIQWHVIPEPRITLQGAEFTVMIPEAHATLQSPGEIIVMIVPHCTV